MGIERIVWASLLVLVASSVQAQTFAEWFRQKKTQKKYLIQQIAALEVYKGYLKKGYSVVKDGTQLIGDISDGEFSLHKDYFGSLKVVNPAIKENSRASDMLDMQAAMSDERERVLGLLKESSLFTEKDMKDIRFFYNRLREDAIGDLRELELILADNKLELDDEQRISRLEALYKSMQQKYSLHRQVSKNLLAILEAKGIKQRDAEILRKLYGIRP